MPSRHRSQALFELARALHPVRDPEAVSAIVGARAHQFSNGRMSVWRWDPAHRLLTNRSGEFEATRDAEQFPARLQALESHRPVRCDGVMVLPLISQGRVLGLLELDGASDGDIASGGMQPWYALAGVVAAALDNAEQFTALQVTEARFRSLVQQIPAATYVDEAVTGRPVYVSPQIESIFAVPAQEWLDGDDGWGSRIHPDDHEHTTAGYDAAVAAAEPWQSEYRLTGTDGVERWVRDDAIVVFDEQGHPTEVQGVIYDITERKTAEQRYLEAEERYRILVEQLPLAIYIDALDEQASSLYNSPQSEAISGYSHAEWQADPGLFERTLHPDDRERIVAGFEQARVLGAPFKADYRIVRPDDQVVWLHDESVVVPGVDGAPGYRQGYLLDISAAKEAEERLAHLAYHDPLTNLPNRAMFREHLDVALARAEREGRGVAVLFVDLDDFKLVNDSFGHGAGDELLVEVAARLRLATRTTDVVARQGGDEFLILVADLTVGGADEEFDIAELALSVAEQLRNALSQPFLIADTEIYCSGSVGISLFPVDAADGESLLKHADIAMYRAKEGGRDAHHLYEREGGDAVARLSMAGRLRRAIDRDQFVLYYQPLVDLTTNDIVGVEALIRWADGERGLVMPSDFIPLAERTGMIAPISEWVINEACRQGAEWRNMGLDLYVSVNLPPVFWQPTAMRNVLATIESFGLSPDRMMVELTESAVMANHRASEPIIAELHERGLKLAIDDFGTGHSSLGRLHQMAVTTLKIDRSFIFDLPSDHSADVLVSTMIALADGLGLQALAEGIETDAQRRWLVEHGCPLGQGFFFSRPVPADQIAGLYHRFGQAEAA